MTDLDPTVAPPRPEPRDWDDGALRRLMNAVLAQATADALRLRRPGASRENPPPGEDGLGPYPSAEETATARAWFREGGEGFETVCRLAGYRPTDVRATLLARLDREGDE